MFPEKITELAHFGSFATSVNFFPQPTKLFQADRSTVLLNLCCALFAKYLRYSAFVQKTSPKDEYISGINRIFAKESLN